jgi:hypothetical protein
LSADANQSIVCGPNCVSISWNTKGSSCQSSLSRWRLSLYAHVFAAERMYLGLMWMLLASNRYHRRRNSVIISWERDVRPAMTWQTAWLSSWRRTFRRDRCGKKLRTARRTAFSYFQVMCCFSSSGPKKPRASSLPFSTALNHTPNCRSVCTLTRLGGVYSCHLRGRVHVSTTVDRDGAAG